MSDTTVLIVGGGFAGVACAQLLAKHDVDVIMLDRNNYHQFQPMLYQVATAQLAADDIARPLRGIFRHDKTVEVRHTAVTSIDLDARSVTTTLGSVLSADYLVIAVGAQANFFGTPGAAEHSLPLYSVNDAERLRTRILEVLDATTERPELIEMGAHRHEVDGPVAFAAWLGVLAMLLSGVRNKIDAFIAWGWDYFSKNRATAMVGAPEAGRIDWGDDDEGEKPEFDPAPTQSAFTRTG